MNPSGHFPLAHCFLGVPEGHLVQTYMAERQGLSVTVSISSSCAHEIYLQFVYYSMTDVSTPRD